MAHSGKPQHLERDAILWGDGPFTFDRHTRLTRRSSRTS